MNCDVGETMEGLENELWSFSNPSVTSPASQLILQPFRRFTYITAYSPTLPTLHLRHSSFFNPYFALPTSQLILQLFRCFTYDTVHSLLFHFSYVTSSSLNSPGEPPMHVFPFDPSFVAVTPRYLNFELSHYVRDCLSLLSLRFKLHEMFMLKSCLNSMVESRYVKLDIWDSNPSLYIFLSIFVIYMNIYRKKFEYKWYTKL